MTISDSDGDSQTTRRRHTLGRRPRGAILSCTYRWQWGATCLAPSRHRSPSWEGRSRGLCYRSSGFPHQASVPAGRRPWRETAGIPTYLGACSGYCSSCVKYGDWDYGLCRSRSLHSSPSVWVMSGHVAGAGLKRCRWCLSGQGCAQAINHRLGGDVSGIATITRSWGCSAVVVAMSRSSAV